MICICFFIGIRCLSWWFLRSSLLSRKNEKNSGGITYCGRAVFGRPYVVKILWPLPLGSSLVPERCAECAARTEKTFWNYFSGKKKIITLCPIWSRAPAVAGILGSFSPTSCGASDRGALTLAACRPSFGLRLRTCRRDPLGLLCGFSRLCPEYPLPDRSGQLVPCRDPLPVRPPDRAQVAQCRALCGFRALPVAL